jgi:serine/threonine protein kinase
MFSVAFHHLPFRFEFGISQSSVTQLLNSEKLVIPTDCGYSQDFIDLIRAILKRDPKKRATVEEIVEHPWFRAVNIQEFDHQNTEEEGETDAARNERSAVESQLNEGQQVPDEGQ